MASEKSPIFGSNEETPAPVSSEDGPSGPIYHGALESKQSKYTLYGFICVIILMVVATLIICIVYGVKHEQGFLYFLLAISLLGFIFIEIMLLRMIRSSDLKKENAWFLYFMGACTIVEALLVDIVIFAN